MVVPGKRAHRVKGVGIMSGVTADAFLDLLTDGVLRVDPSGVVVRANASAARLLGTERIPGRPVTDLFADGTELEDAVASGCGGSWVLRPASDSFFRDPVDVTVQGGTDTDGCCVWLLRGAAFRTSRERRLFYQATHDYVTGLYNRRMFEEQLQQEIERFSTTLREVSVMIVSLGGVREVAGRLGYRSADNLLLLATSAIVQQLHDRGVIARIGDSEFGIILPSTAAPLAVLIAERLLEALQAVPAIEGAEDVALAPSVGIAVCPDSAESAVTLLVAADRAMCLAQRGECGCAVAPVTRPRHVVPRAYPCSPMPEIRSGVA